MNRFLIAFGTSALIVNGAIYSGFHDVLKWHGAVQVLMGSIGGICAIVGLLRDKKRV